MKQRMDLIYKCIPNSRYTPYLLAKKIGATAILESASFAKGRERYSILMTEEAFKIKQDEERISLIINGTEKPFDMYAAMQGEKSLDALGREKLLIFLMHFFILQAKMFYHQADPLMTCPFQQVDLDTSVTSLQSTVTISVSLSRRMI